MKTTLLLVGISLFTLCTARAQCDGADYEENGGIVVIEMESTSSLASGWQRETGSSGFTGNSFLAWRGSTSFNTPGNGTISYTIRINTPGRYRFVWRNSIGIIAETRANTEHNDSWLRIPDADLFFGQRGTSRVFPGGSGRTPTPEGSSSGGWFKVYSNSIDWSWNTNTSDNDPHQIFADFNSAGVYTVQISGRSTGHFIDRMVLFQENMVSFASATNLERNETVCDGDTPPPPVEENSAPTVSFTSPADGQVFNEGTNVSVNLSANDTDGTVVRHQIFVNGILVDTDGTNFTPHTIVNSPSGNYIVRAVVTDNEGATTETQVQFTVEDDTPPPPPPVEENLAPTVRITNPSNGQVFNEGSTVSVDLSADDTDGSVVRYQIFVNGTLVDTDGVRFTPHPIVNIPLGNYVVRAVVTDNEGATAETQVQFTVEDGTPPPVEENNAPTLRIVSPSNGQTFNEGATVSVGLAANDEDGSVVRYQIFVNGTLVDTDGARFTPHPISNIASGDYFIRAVATDNDGATTESRVQFSVRSNASVAAQRTIAFPNPIADNNRIALKVSEEISEGLSYMILNAAGMELQKGNVQKTDMPKDGILQIQANGLRNPGVYYVIINSFKGTETIPIIKR